MAKKTRQPRSLKAGTYVIPRAKGCEVKVQIVIPRPTKTGCELTAELAVPRPTKAGTGPAKRSVIPRGKSEC
jgi:hypothetical protein